MSYKKKLIEVALPLEAINTASAREKSIRHGHPSTLHLWWARRPLAAARAVIFAQMVDDPSVYVDELLADAPTRREAERAYRARLKTWEERSATYEKAHVAGMTGASNPEPGPQPTLEDTAATIERARLFRILEQLVLWENTTNETVLEMAQAEIWRSWRRICDEKSDHHRAAEFFNPNELPAFHDPFAGGGSLPLEAQRLGLKSYASDLNPVAVLINKAMIEIPPKYANCPPVNPEARMQKTLLDRTWRGAEGLAEDLRYYGKLMRDEAEKRIGYLYPKIVVTTEMAKDRQDLVPYIGQKLTVIAWIWARTVKSPNPAFSHIDVPLAATFMLSTKVGKEAYVEPVVENNGYHFEVKIGKPKNLEATKCGTKSGSSGSSFLCLMSKIPMPFEYLRSEAKAGRMGMKLMAIVAESDRGRIYLPPTQEMEKIVSTAQPQNVPDTYLPEKALGFRVQEYGMKQWRDLFTPRQLVSLTTFSSLVQEMHDLVKKDAFSIIQSSDDKPLEQGGSGATAYADAIGAYLSIAVSRITNTINALAVWSQSREQSVNLFSRQAIPMAWDFPEVNPFAGAAGDFEETTKSISKTIINTLGQPACVSQADAKTQYISQSKVVSTDPPYYDNVGYADLSDFFYVWLRRSLNKIFPALFATLAVPKTDELIASPFRQGNKQNAEKFFLDGMTQAMSRLANQAHGDFPVTIYYAFKQSESEGADGTASTGWETFLDAVIKAGFAISGTWPIRTERPSGVKTGTNALASSIVLVCRKLQPNAAIATRRELVNALQTELPHALVNLQASNIAPVDLAQAAIGPGMAVYTRYAKVLDAQGKPLTVRQALALINQTLDEVLAEQEGDFDADTRWALAWFEQHGFTEGEFGVAETLSKAKDTSVGGMVEAGIVTSGRGKVRLLKPAELPADWNPTADKRLTAWEMVHQLIRALEKDGESGAAQLIAKLGAKAETARELCYRLYTLCERKKRATEALSYNGLVQSWPEIVRLARENAQSQATQAPLF